MAPVRLTVFYLGRFSGEKINIIGFFSAGRGCPASIAAFIVFI
jgi:hypothetical protein